MHLLNVHYPAVEYPNFRYDDDTHKVMTKPLKPFSKNAPDISEIRLKSGAGNQAVVESLQRYMGGSDDVRKYSKVKKNKEVFSEKQERFETTREQSNTILFVFMYIYVLNGIFLIWYFFFRR